MSSTSCDPVDQSAPQPGGAQSTGRSSPPAPTDPNETIISQHKTTTPGPPPPALRTLWGIIYSHLETWCLYFIKTISLHLHTWWLPVIHTLICTAISVVIITYLDGYMALDDATGSLIEFAKLETNLRVGDVTTILSAALVVNSFVVSGWTALTIWRCAYILMEAEEGFKPTSINRVLKYRIPLQIPVSRVGWVVALVLLLMVPQSFVGPVITGAVGWSTVLEFETETQDIHTTEEVSELSLNKNIAKHLNISGGGKNDTIDWSFLIMNTRREKKEEQRKTNFLTSYIPARASGVTNMLWDPDAIRSKVSESQELEYYKNPCRQRVAPRELGNQITIGSRTRSLDMPCIIVERISWLPIPDELLNRTVFDTYSNVSMFGANLLHTILPGVAIIFDPDALRLEDKWPIQGNATNDTHLELIDLPDPEVVTQTLTLMMLLGLDSEDADCDLARLGTHSIFGTFKNSNLPQTSVKHEGHLWCFAYGKVNVTAGLVEFNEAEFVTNGAFEGKRDTALTRKDFKPDRWARPALMMLPDLMYRVSMSNTSRIATWDNLDGYIETLITRTYSGMWGVLRTMENDNQIIQVHLAASRLQATISKWRVWTWWAVNMLVPLSAVLWYFGAQRRCVARILMDPILEALFTQPPGVWEDAPQQTTSNDVRAHKTKLSRVKDQCNKMGRMRLAKNNRGYKLEILPEGPGRPVLPLPPLPPPGDGHGGSDSTVPGPSGN